MLLHKPSLAVGRKLLLHNRHSRHLMCRDAQMPRWQHARERPCGSQARYDGDDARPAALIPKLKDKQALE